MFEEDHTLKMPTNYVDMSMDEMEYDGGFSWGKLGFALSCVAIVAGFVALGAAFGGVAFGVLATVGAMTEVGGLLGFAFTAKYGFGAYEPSPSEQSQPS